MTNVYATFDDAHAARNAMGALLDHGAKVESISLVLPEDYEDHFQGEVPTAEHEKDEAQQGITTTTAADASSGAATGAGLGLGIGLVGAIASLAIPGIGLVLGGGALATALAAAAGTTAADAIAGGVTGYLKDQGIPDEKVTRYSEIYSGGGAILTITVPSGDVDAPLAENILSKYGHANTEVWHDTPGHLDIPIPK